jgi:predicted transcriptional regulator
MDIRATVIEAMRVYYWRIPANTVKSNQLQQQLSCNRLAELSSVPVRSINDFINGKSNINSDALGRILDALMLSIVSTSEVASLKERVSQLEREAKEKWEKRLEIESPRQRQAQKKAATP